MSNDTDHFPVVFQSTLPTRGSDAVKTFLPSFSPDFNPRSPRGGATDEDEEEMPKSKKFQSTLPTKV